MLNPLNTSTAKAPIPVFLNRGGGNSCCGEANVGGDGSGGVVAFVELVDVPNSYAGQAGKIVSVRTDETGLEFTEQSATGWRPARRVARDDGHFVDNDYTYIDGDLAGVTFFVYANGTKMLTEQEGFEILPGGGFTYDPTKFQFYDGDFLYMIF